MGPPQAVKDKHVRLRVSPAVKGGVLAAVAAEAFVPRCDPDSAAIRERAGAEPGPAPTQSSWRSNVTFKAMGWGLKESCDKLQLLAGDRLDIAYTLGMNDHPEFGGLELTLRDVRRSE